MQDREATFRILEKALRALRNSHLGHCPHILITLWTITRGPKALLHACEYHQPPLLEYRSVKKNGRGQYVYLLQPKFVKYCTSGVAPRKSRKRLSATEVRDAIFDDEMTRTPPPPTFNLVDDVNYLLSIKFSQIPFSGCRQKVKNVSVNLRPWRPYLFSDRPE